MSRSNPAPTACEGVCPVVGPAPIDARRISDLLIDWFPDAARDLPWRRLRSGYHALVSEAMLQQTQVQRVLPAFQRFIERFPTIAILAAASEEEVMASWQGLGYYRRARNLHAAAMRIVEEFGGEIPATERTLKELPGVGRYTAGAIASIVFGERAPIVDGNIGRVLARLAAHPGTPGERAFDSWCWERAEDLAKVARDPGQTNEALMELGALVCTRHQPECTSCPLREECAAHAAGDAARIPPPRRTGPRQKVHHHAVLVRRDGEVLLMRRGEKGLWARMWEPPTCECSDPLSPSEVARRVPARVSGVRGIGRFEHRTTHRDVVFHVHLAERGQPNRGIEARWQSLEQLEEIGLSNPHRRVIEHVGRQADAVAPRMD